MESFLFIILANFLLAESRVFLGQKDKWIRSFAEPRKMFIPSSQTSCSCADGLSCEVFMKFGSEEFYRCMKKEEYRD
ncbi:hypothetical protein P5673_019282 [Acropora cervicornis]|uniref:Uncharacterized protein n=1 Tax=Acropora cervicornis TaxID=6130 RepID=A0AAD9V1V8_ACRCE|nr:hypothetical protein P5673_019282 [Acropora cervicornis]